MSTYDEKASWSDIAKYYMRFLHQLFDETERETGWYRAQSWKTLHDRQRAFLESEDLLTRVRASRLQHLEALRDECDGCEFVSSAFSKGAWALFDALIELGCSPNDAWWSVGRAADSAAALVADVDRLLAAGADPNYCGRSGTALQQVVRSEHSFLAVQRMLEAGADPLQRGRSGYTAALDAGRNKDPRVLALLREAAAPQIASMKRGSGLKVKRRRQRYELPGARGLEDFVRSKENHEYRFSLMFVQRVDASEVAEVLAGVAGASQTPEDVLRRVAPAAHRARWIVRLEDSGWTTIVRDTGHTLFGPEYVEEFRRVAEEAPVLSRALGDVPVLHVWGLTLREWRGAEKTCDRDYSEEGIDESELPDEDSAAGDRAYDALAAVRRMELSDELVRRGVFFPPAEDTSDGFFDYLVLAGVRKRDVAELLRVVLQREVPDAS